MPNNPVKSEAHKIFDILKETGAEWTLRVENEIPIKHGQFIQLSLPKIGEAPTSTSGFGDGYADFTIRKVGKVTDELFQLKKGDQIFIRGCYENGWPTEQSKRKPVVIVAGEAGVSPVKSLIHQLYKNPEDFREVYLILGFKSSKSTLSTEKLEQWKTVEYLHVVYTLDNEDYPGWKRGFVTEFVRDIPSDPFGEDYECFVVGSPVMMRFAAKSLIDNQVSEDKIWMPFERKMSYVIGKCGYCRTDETYVCLDRPVFNYTAGKKLVD